MRKLLPVILALIGVASGIGAGVFLKPEQIEESGELNTAETCGPLDPAQPQQIAALPSVDPATREYVRLNNQFIVPVVLNEKVNALMVLSLSIEVSKGQTQAVFDREPKLRDAFLQVLFNHANSGGFRGAFTETRNMTALRQSLREAGVSVLGDVVSDVLITDLARQDV